MAMRATRKCRPSANAGRTQKSPIWWNMLGQPVCDGIRCGMAARGTEACLCDNCSAVTAEMAEATMIWCAKTSSDAIWLVYGGDRANVEQTIRYSRFLVLCLHGASALRGRRACPRRSSPPASAVANKTKARRRRQGRGGPVRIHVGHFGACFLMQIKARRFRCTRVKGRRTGKESK